jgi:SAM-dependent methyltransferase
VINVGKEMEKRASLEVIEEFLHLDGATVIDVGCGNGWLTRQMTRRGAHVHGVEVSPRQLALARAAKAVADEDYIQGSAEDLPFPNRFADIVIYFNSLHHVDGSVMQRALHEAARVLKHGGVLFISEPFPEGPYFELMKTIHDETIVRNNAQRALMRAPEYGLLLEKSLSHLDTVSLANFQAFHDRLTTINPNIRTRFEEEEEVLKRDFARLGTQTEDGWVFEQPMRVAVLRRV